MVKDKKPSFVRKLSVSSALRSMVLGRTPAPMSAPDSATYARSQADARLAQRLRVSTHHRCYQANHRMAAFRDTCPCGHRHLVGRTEASTQRLPPLTRAAHGTTLDGNANVRPTCDRRRLPTRARLHPATIQRAFPVPLAHVRSQGAAISLLTPHPCRLGRPPSPRTRTPIAMRDERARLASR